MDTARKFEPRTILLWRQVEEDPEAQRIISLFPSADVQVVKQQRCPQMLQMPPAKAILEGKRTIMIGRTTSFVKHFDGGLGHNICCKPYYKLVPLSNGCPYFCIYCYLAFIYRKYAPFIKVNINYDTMFRQIRKTITGSTGKISFNMGEMLDSLALDHVTNLTTRLIPLFADYGNGYLTLLTKSSNIENLLRVEPSNRVIVSWSLNSQRVTDGWEFGTASLIERLKAARRCQEHGYRIRVRIDPGILCDNWEVEYTQLIKEIFAHIQSENITIGMLRLLPGHIGLARAAYGRRARQLNTQRLVPGASDGKLRYRPEQRIEFYRFLIDGIRSYDKHISISLCRESRQILSYFKEQCDQLRCNCMPWQERHRQSFLNSTQIRTQHSCYLPYQDALQSQRYGIRTKH